VRGLYGDIRVYGGLVTSNIDYAAILTPSDHQQRTQSHTGLHSPDENAEQSARTKIKQLHHQKEREILRKGISRGLQGSKVVPSIDLDTRAGSTGQQTPPMGTWEEGQGALLVRRFEREACGI